MFKAPFSFKGRITRTEYIISTIVFLFVYGFSLPKMIRSEDLFVILFNVAAWFWLAQGAKRCHDFGQVGWIQIIPIINPIVLWLFQGSTGENQYGLDPRFPNATPTPTPAAPATPVRPPLTNPPPYTPPTRVASFRCTSCGAQNKDISYTQSPSCEFCGAPYVKK
jgi:uncharacterized membrane protein YhaH (DUF805 family)